MNHSQPAFLTSFLSRSLNALGDRPAQNYDRLRFPAPAPRLPAKIKRGVKAAVRNALLRARIIPIPAGDLTSASAGILRITQRHQDLDRVLGLLGDDRSRQLLVELMAFRALGPSHVKLPTNTPDYWQKVEAIPGLVEEPDTHAVAHLGRLSRYRLDRIGFDLRLHAHPLNILGTFLLEQYRYPHSRPPVEVAAGDVCLDAGGCWGDTALYFAARAGASGRVYCFEFIPSNLAVVRANLALNPVLGQRVTVAPSAVWDRSGEALHFVDCGPASRLPREGETATVDVSTVAIDDFVRREQLRRLDFLKMDIEGAELAALRGAEGTLRAFRPKLAIALYHRLEDFIDIPTYLDGLGLGYRFFLGHFTIHAEETFLFATAR